MFVPTFTSIHIFKVIRVLHGLYDWESGRILDGHLNQLALSVFVF